MSSPTRYVLPKCFPKCLITLYTNTMFIRDLIALYTNTMMLLILCQSNAYVIGYCDLFYILLVTLFIILFSVVQIGSFLFFYLQVHSFIPLTIVLLLSFFVLSYCMFSSKLLEFVSLHLPSLCCVFLIFHLCFKNVHSC